MTEMCLTAVTITMMCNITRIIIKKLDIDYCDRKNQKEGRYIN